MIEAHNSKLNVDQLIQKVRQEVAKRQSLALLSNLTSSVTPLKDIVNFDYIEALVDTAESRASVRKKWPDKLSRFPFNFSKVFKKSALKLLEIIFRDQHEVNSNLLQAFREVIHFNRQLTEQVVTLQVQISSDDNRLGAIEERLSNSDNRLGAVEERLSHSDNRLGAVEERLSNSDNRLGAVEERLSNSDNRLGAVEERLSNSDNRLGAVEERLSHSDNRLGAVEERLSNSDNRLGAVEERLSNSDNRLGAVEERLSNSDNRLGAVEERLSNSDNRLGAVEERLSNSDNRLGAVEERLSNSDNRLGVIEQRFSTSNNRLGAIEQRFSTSNNRLGAIEQRFSTSDNRLGAIEQRFSTMDERHLRNDTYLKDDLTQQKRLITLFLEEARQRLPEPLNREQLQTFIKEEEHLSDAFYVAFEDLFRGSQEDILERLKVYLPLIAEANGGTPDAPILDVGCGRGEWLELLRESGYVSQGVDINRVMIEQCRAKNLVVTEAGVISYMQTLPDASLGAVTGFHIIEHLQFAVLMDLFNETLRVLRSGGVLIFETPNPRNILVGSGDFYRDPTHRNPIHPDTINFIAESKGFVRSESYFFEYKGGNMSFLKSSEKKFDDLNDYVNISRDYALVAYKL